MDGTIPDSFIIFLSIKNINELSIIKWKKILILSSYGKYDHVYVTYNG